MGETEERCIPHCLLVERAAADGRVIVTFDKDIPRILALRFATKPSALILRVGDQTPDYVAPLLLAALDSHREALATGAILTVTDTHTRARGLPIRAQHGDEDE